MDGKLFLLLGLNKIQMWGNETLSNRTGLIDQHLGGKFAHIPNGNKCFWSYSILKKEENFHKPPPPHEPFLAMPMWLADYVDTSQKMLEAY